MQDYHYDPSHQALEAFDNLLQSSRPWILIYHGPPKSGKSHLLSWLIRNRCKDIIPYSLVSYYTYTFDIDVLFSSMAESIISTSQFSRDKADRIKEKLTGGVNAHWVGLQDNMSLILFFDDYQAFEAKASSEQLSTFLDMMNHAHMRLPGLRVVMASRDGNCKIPRIWDYMQEVGHVNLYLE